ncbi:unnamed protein product [Paramecium primaurelia]|uniref:Band 7 domain-containing protein n=1 Tax=Paramecium primaurelia TaxID=5886 RepID=A0A8S1LSM9_PARPR|nr:unnamed protein product [Paramecium primaurelia]
MGAALRSFFVPVPHQTVCVLQRFGKYTRILTPGLNWKIPFIDEIAYEHSLKEQAFMIYAQNAVTKDNVIISIDGVLYIKVDDPFNCSYGAQKPIDYAQILAQSVMRAEIGKLTLDQTFEEREKMNGLILAGLSEAVQEWGLKCLRYEIKDIKVTENVRKAMNMEAEAERTKRTQILHSEAKQQSQINLAEGERLSKILKAEGLAQSIVIRSTATVQRIEAISSAMNSEEGDLAARFNLAEEYLEAFKKLEGKQVLVNSDVNNPKEVIRKALDMVDARLK